MTQPAAELSPACVELKALADGEAGVQSVDSEAGSRHNTPSGHDKTPEPAPLAPLRWRVANMCLCSLAWCCNISAFFLQVRPGAATPASLSRTLDARVIKYTRLNLHRA